MLRRHDRDKRVTVVDFADALEPHYEDAARYCRALCARQTIEDAEDVLQDALLRALGGYPRLRDPGAFKGWLFRIITTTAAMHRRRSFWRRFAPLPTVEREQGPFPAVYQRQPPTPEVRRVLAALADLTERERVALLLHDVAGFRVEELMRIQGERSLSAVKSRLARARARIRQSLETGRVTAYRGDDVGTQVITLLDAMNRRSAG